MSTAEHAEACVRFATTLVATHHSAATQGSGAGVARCSCGRAAVLCEVNSAAREAGLLAPVTGTPASRAGDAW